MKNKSWETDNSAFWASTHFAVTCSKPEDCGEETPLCRRFVKGGSQTCRVRRKGKWWFFAYLPILVKNHFVCFLFQKFKVCESHQSLKLKMPKSSIYVVKIKIYNLEACLSETPEFCYQNSWRLFLNYFK